MSRSRPARPLVALALVVAALVAVSAVVASRRASAYVPEQRYSTAIDAAGVAAGYQQAQLLGLIRAESPGPDGIFGYDGTPDRRGAFVYFQVAQPDGTWLREAVYAFQYTSTASRMLARITGESVPAGTVKGRIVHNNVLAHWVMTGAEAGNGYPLTDARGATSADIARGCRAGDTVQYFQRITGFQETRILCLTGASPKWTRVWI
jgi:hypothetical protein